MKRCALRMGSGGALIKLYIVGSVKRPFMGLAGLTRLAFQARLRKPPCSTNKRPLYGLQL